jgi:DNA polymerase elongation subunit (family B)
LIAAQDALDYIEDMREYDVPYHQRFAIDMDVRAGQWFMVSGNAGHISLAPRKVTAIAPLFSLHQNQHLSFIHPTIRLNPCLTSTPHPTSLFTITGPAAARRTTHLRF